MKVFSGLLTAFLLGGCASLPKNFNAPPSSAFPPDNSTSIGQILKTDLVKRPQKSAFVLLDTAESAFIARVAMADVAEKSIDAQYFIWNGDEAGIILMDRLVKAADRGVRVRLLMDDLTTHGKDLGLAALNQHKNIEIRLFNPLGRRYYSGFFRTVAMAFHAGRMTNRMHNKVYVVDNQLGIVGGRNIADEYFGLDKRLDFRDMDVLAAGPVVVDVSLQFDQYWNSPWSVPLEVFQIKVPSEKKLEKQMASLHKRFDKTMKKFPYKINFTKDSLLQRLNELRAHFIWSTSEVISDAPGKAWKPAKAGESSSAIVNRLVELSETATEATIISPYLLLSDNDINKFKERIQNGMSVTILTNSMTSTDAIPVVAQYKGTRKKILEAGVKLYEVRPDAEVRMRHQVDKKAIHGLHAKVTVINRKDVFIGTFNIDPRSQYLNTETGILVHSAELSGQVLKTIDVDLLPINSWQLGLTENKKVRWTGETNGKQVEYHSDPGAGFWRKLAAGILSLLPIKGQL